MQLDYRQTKMHLLINTGQIPLVCMSVCVCYCTLMYRFVEQRRFSLIVSVRACVCLFVYVFDADSQICLVLLDNTIPHC